MKEGEVQDHIWELLEPFSTPARKRIVGALQGRVLEHDMLLHQEEWLREREAHWLPESEARSIKVQQQEQQKIEEKP